MAKNTYITLSGEAYVAKLDDTPVHSPNGMHRGLLFTIENKKGETIGCLSAFVTGTTKAVWNSQEQLTPELLENLFLRILPHISFSADISDFTSIYSACVQLYIESSETRYDKEKKVQYIQSRETPSALVNHLVFDDEMDDDKVQKDILTYLYDVHRQNHQTHTHTITMAKELLVDEQTVFRCLKYLYDDGLIEGEEADGLALVMITTPGVRYVRSNFLQIFAGTGVIVMGDFVGNDKTTTIVNGDGNVTNVKSTITNSFNTQVIEKVDSLKAAIQKDYSGEDKDEIIAEVEEIKTLAQDKGNFAKIREMLGGVLAKTSKYAPIGALVIEVIKLFTGQ